MALAQKGSLEGRRRDAEHAWTEGVILLAEGRAGESEARLHQAAEAILCELCVLPDLARALDAKGDTDGAIDAYERYLSTPWLFRYEVELEPALERLAELYDARSERNRALETRTRLLALWRRADATLQPVLADVRTRSRSLTDELEPKRGAPGEAPRVPAR